MSVKDDLLKKIAATVKRKQELAKEIAHEKTVSYWVAEFFKEVENVRSVDQTGNFKALALSNLISNIRKIDRRVTVIHKEPTVGEPQIEIRWSAVYVGMHDCEPVIVLDASSAFFQSMVERS